MTRLCLRVSPDGRVYAEAARTGDAGIYTYQITVRKHGEHLYVDNAGTDQQTGSINVTYAGFSGAFLAELTASLTADLAGAYGGVYRRVHFEPVPGTLSCADFPAAVSPAGIYTMETLISLSGAVIGKMLACAEPEVAELTIGPAHPVFYGFISGGVHPTGEPFVATNADNMIGSLAASPGGDGVDFGGHFRIPEGTASNVEELELLWPMLLLYRRALQAGAGGAGRFRGGRGFVEAGIPWTVPGMAAALYVDESFPNAVGPFGGNPGSAGHFRLKHGTNVVARLAAGEVPRDFDAIDDAEAEIQAKGPMLMMGADAVWEWTGANAPGFGDPLTRDPGQVAADVASRALPAVTAEQVYGVLPGDGATRTLRARRLAARLAEAVPPPATLEGDGRPEAFVTVTGRAVLAPASGNFKDGCAVLERPLQTVGPEFATREDGPVASRDTANTCARSRACGSTPRSSRSAMRRYTTSSSRELPRDQHLPGPILASGVSADPASLTARAKPEARPEMSAANLCNPAPARRTDFTSDYYAVCI